MIGLAAGDALGYAVEFSCEKTIFEKYGKCGITGYDLKNGVAEISDDTQMTLFTATGLLLATTRGLTRGISGHYETYVNYSYKDWLRTQTEKYENLQDEGYHYSWLANVPEMFHRRAPGNTCISAIMDKKDGSIENPINDSKGCGGIMRVAPVGLYREAAQYDGEDLDMLGAKIAALTHGHELGYIPAAVLVHIIDKITHENMTIKEAVDDAMTAVYKLFKGFKHLEEFQDIMAEAIKLAEDPEISDLDAIHKLGEGWMAEETLAIAIYCALKYPDNFDKAVRTAVNHNGDSDSTGAVAGSIVGAYVGLSGIPEKYTEHLELKEVILTLANDLYNDCPITEYGPREGYKQDPNWKDKYIKNVFHL